MTVLATDNFNRANNVDLGAAWDVVTGESTFKIASNAALPNSDTDCAESNNTVAWPADQYAQAKVTENITTTGIGPGVVIRAATGARTYYRALANKAVTANVAIEKFVAGVYTSVATRTTTWVNGDVLYLEARGTTLTVKQNGVALGAPVSDAAIASGRAGLCYSSTGGVASALDDWEGGSPDSPSIAPSYADFPPARIT